ncbi:MAG: PilZ domain-containing protein [Parvibaculum sp.]|uniref:PilZ domain-containing protein n=1 Tax=Parvibaculum sp. TaxID=2024848 RepID=UPI003C76EEC5
MSDQHERRRYPRVPVSVKGRFLAPDGAEHACSIRDMSLAGIALISEVEVPLGSHLIIYLDDFGRFEGPVVRHFDDGFAIETALTGPRRDRVAERLALYAKGGEKAAAERRRIFPRYAPQDAGIEEGSVLTLSDGRTAPCRIVDMSLGGANVATELRAPIGMSVSIGRMNGRIVRHTVEGIAIEFTDMPERVSAISRPFG